MNPVLSSYYAPSTFNCGATLRAALEIILVHLPSDAVVSEVKTTDKELGIVG